MMELPVSSKLNIQAFRNMLSLKRIRNSYKLYFFAGVFAEIKEGNFEITIQRLVFRMIAKSWYSIVEYRLNFGSQDKLGKLVLDIYDNYEVA